MLTSIQDIATGVATTFFILGTITILLRVYARGFVIKHFGWDDWCMSSILFFNAGQQAILYYFIKYGAGLRIAQIATENPQWVPKLIEGLFAEEIMYTWMHFTIKVAFLLFYLRFATKLFRKLVFVTMVINAVFTLATLLLYCFQCLPLDAFFHPERHPDVKCVSKSFLGYVPASFSIFVDILIVVLPIKSLWAIQVSLRKRLALISLICLGGVVVIISCIRLYVLTEFQKETADFSWVLGKLIIISSVELQAAIMVANAPSLKVLFQFWFLNKKPLSSDRGTESKRTYGNGSMHGRGKSFATDTYAVDCTKSVRMSERQTKKAGSPDEHKLQHSDSEEQLWRQDSGIMVDRSVSVAVSDKSTGALSSIREKSPRATARSGGSDEHTRITPSPIEEERSFKDNFEAV